MTDCPLSPRYGSFFRHHERPRTIEQYRRGETVIIERFCGACGRYWQRRDPYSVRLHWWEPIRRKEKWKRV